MFLSLAYLLDNPVYDAIGSICIGVILILVSFFLIIRLKSLLIGKSADPDIQAAISDHIESDPSIISVLNLITVQLGPYIMLAGKVRLIDSLDINTACSAINSMERKLKETFPEVMWSFIEPDINK